MMETVNTIINFFSGNAQSEKSDHPSSSTSELANEGSSLVAQNESQILPPMVRLPSEIMLEIFSYLEFRELINIMKTCHALKKFAEQDSLWSGILRQYLPLRDFPKDSAYPASDYRHLYGSHHPYWFLPQHKIWLSDEAHVGKVILCKFDPRRGCIEGYRVLAHRGSSNNTTWAYKPSVLIHSFDPRVHLWLDDPVLNLPHAITPAMHGRQGWWEGEIKMNIGTRGHNTPASFFLARNVPQQFESPSMYVWPPRTIPNMPRVRASSQNNFTGKEHKPQKFEEISQTTFRMRHWSQFFTGLAHVGVRLGEEVSTWSTLDLSLYTPTKDKPYQGIFVGDYAGHGCEFLLVMQTAKAPPRPRNTRPSDYLQAILRAMEDEVNDDDTNMTLHNTNVEPNLVNDVAHSGAIEAIKLTGDPNVPRGEHSFIADDIGPKGLIRIAAEAPFRGARVVHCRGHVANRGFENGRSNDFLIRIIH